MRPDGRKDDALRKVTIVRNCLKTAEGSTLIELGDTRVLCAATVEERVPPFLRETGTGWVTAEYGMLPRSTITRMSREGDRARPAGRTFEIQRLIGRSLRCITDLSGFGPRTIILDCDVIQADGGTRTAAITGAFVALVDAFNGLKELGIIAEIPVKDYVAAVSVGLARERVLLDLSYEEDSQAEVDMNFVMTGDGRYVEIQGTAEKSPFPEELFLAMAMLAKKGIRELILEQKKIIGEILNRKDP